MRTDVWLQKGIEREKLRRLFQEKAASPPIPATLFGYDPVWENYCEEMRAIEAALRSAGERI